MMGTKDYLLGLELGARQSFENMAVFPLRFSRNGGPEYITLKEALERGVFVVAEVSAGGSVPELMVENKGEVAVLLLDGEELAGAKQNRVLNTTILVGPKSQIKVPVSCTEHGRWSYVSNVLYESGNVMAPALRELNLRGVSTSLRTSQQYRSDQGAVWDGLARMSEEAGVHSITGAMRDVYEAKKTVLEDYLKSFKLESGQKGVLVFIGGEVAGLDFLSREQAFAVLHAKLVKSYAMEAMLVGEREKAAKGERKAEEGKKAAGGKRRRNGSKESEGGGAGKSGEGGKEEAGREREAGEAGELKPDEAIAHEFLAQAAECGEMRYESVGLGSSLRYEGQGVIGSALSVNEKIIHMAFFRTSQSEGERVGEIAALGSRRRFRTG
jgi:hypothetical protein